jgi:hypothetical protein
MNRFAFFEPCLGWVAAASFIVTMKSRKLLTSTAATLLLASWFSALAQEQPVGPAPDQPPGRGRGGRGFGGGGFRFGGPMLSAEERAEVERINTALQPETTVVSEATSNLVVATFADPVDKEKIARANEELSKARAAWATKAARLFAETQASDKKLSSNAVSFLVQSASGRGGRGGFPPFGFGPGAPGGFRGPRGDDGTRGGARGRPEGPNPQ